MMSGNSAECAIYMRFIYEAVTVFVNATNDGVTGETNDAVIIK